MSVMNSTTFTAYKNAAAQARGLAIDAIADRKSGHLGLPLGCAEIGAVLFGQVLRYDPKHPEWLNRDRFILSAGHGSMFLYSWLHICGYDISITDVANFRVMGSKTPGHPEFGITPGVEITSGPLGQGIGNAVGMAMAEKMAEARFNSEEVKIFSHKVYCLAGDGCLQEGIAAEACSLAGLHKLDNLVILYDSNGVTLDEMLSKTQADDVKKRFESYGFEVILCDDGHDLEKIEKAFKKASKANGKPKIIIFKTIIAKGICQVENSNKGHGEGGAKFAAEAKAKLGLPDSKFFVSPDTYAFFAKRAKKGSRERKAWLKTFESWKTANPQKAALLADAKGPKPSAEELLSRIPSFDGVEKIATRAAGGKILNALSVQDASIITGAADLFGSTKNYIKDGGDFSPENYGGRNIWFGIREHAMGAICNGFAYYGLFKPSCATFLTFAGYMMGAIRISALAKLPEQYFFTHDSIGVGLDGPTHQPVELVAQLRCLPRLNVIRPADAEECAAAYALAYSRKDGPTALILSRQDLPVLTQIPSDIKRKGTLRGAYIAKKETSALQKIIISTGSELHLALEAAKDDDSVRVVSMPCMEIFDAQPNTYKQEILPNSCKNRLAVEAGASMPWYKYASRTICTDDFGFSAQESELYAHFGLTVENIKKS